METKKITLEEIQQKLVRQSVYFYDDFDEVCIKITKNDNCYAKFMGEKEFRVSSDVDYVIRCYLGNPQISKYDYDKY